MEGDLKIVDGAVNGVGNSILSAGLGLRRTQSGYAQGYLLWMALGVFGLVLIYIVF